MSSNDTLNCPRCAIHYNYLCGITEGGVNDGVLNTGFTQLCCPVHPVLANVVDLFGAVCGTRCLTGSFHSASTHEGSARTSGLTQTEFTRGIDDDFDSERVDTKFLNGDL